MTTCAECRFWRRGTVTRYTTEDRSVLHVDGEGNAPCHNPTGPLVGVTVPSTFGCALFEAYDTFDDQIEIIVTGGEPWQSWHMGPCPDCSAKGSTLGVGCHRCAGTGNVRYYDDGHVGEEQTRLHPRERERHLAAVREAALQRMREELAIAEKAQGPAKVENIPL